MINYKTRIYGKTKNISIAELRDVFGSDKADFIDIALLFGSRALDTHHSKSDYDFALKMRDDFDAPWGVKAEAYTVLSDILKLDDCDFDVIDLQNADSVIKESIKEGYIVLKGEEDEVSRLLR